MSEDRDDIIEAQQAPLSHLSKAKSRTRWSEYLDWRSAAVGVAVLTVLVGAILWEPEIAAPPARTPASSETPAELAANPRQAGLDKQLAPFAQAQRERVRSQAQEALAAFVERQIELEENMQVAAWGSNELDAAMALAKTGDEAFLREQFDESLQAYEEATATLAEVIAQGNRLFEQHLADGRRFIAEFDPQAAEQSLQAALTIKPEDSDALAQAQRAQNLPDMIAQLRTAKNHELGGRYAEALAIYQAIRQLDPQTTGLQALIDAANGAQAGNDLTSFISRGFAALERNDFDGAKRAFNRALALDPGNDIAIGGLQQVAKQNDLAIIRRHQSDAEAAMAAESWSEAISSYEEVLKLDGNIQFALNGLSAAQAHLRAQRLLQRISDEPQKLSSEKLYLDATAILAQARTLPQPGPKLNALVARVDDLLTIYRDPVDVVLLSDNATNVIMSNVGQLGYFERKTLSLRPGQYTIRGSQDGCRDIFLSVEVIPGIAPVDLSCPESINP